MIAQDIDFTRDCFYASRIGDYGQVKRIPCGINRQARAHEIHEISGLEVFKIDICLQQPVTGEQLIEAVKSQQ